MAKLNATYSIGATLLTLACLSQVSRADEPCGELDECRVLIEINASDGDIGFHVLFDAEGWTQATISDPKAHRELLRKCGTRLRRRTQRRPGRRIPDAY